MGRLLSSRCVLCTAALCRQLLTCGGGGPEGSCPFLPEFHWGQPWKRELLYCLHGFKAWTEVKLPVSSLDLQRRLTLELDW